MKSARLTVPWSVRSGLGSMDCEYNAETKWSPNRMTHTCLRSDPCILMFPRASVYVCRITVRDGTKNRVPHSSRPYCDEWVFARKREPLLDFRLTWIQRGTSILPHIAKSAMYGAPRIRRANLYTRPVLCACSCAW